VAALVNGIVSGQPCGPSSTQGGVRDEQVQTQLFHIHPVDTQAQKESPSGIIAEYFPMLVSL
jgi:hypothetical protein